MTKLCAWLGQCVFIIYEISFIITLVIFRNVLAHKQSPFLLYLTLLFRTFSIFNMILNVYVMTVYVLLFIVLFLLISNIFKFAHFGHLEETIIPAMFFFDKVIKFLLILVLVFTRIVYLITTISGLFFF